jgi:hypothetical protein
MISAAGFGLAAKITTRTNRESTSRCDLMSEVADIEEVGQPPAPTRAPGRRTSAATINKHTRKSILPKLQNVLRGRHEELYL